MKLLWPRSSRFFAFILALSCFALLLSALLSPHLVTATATTPKHQPVTIEVGLFTITAGDPVDTSAPIPATCAVSLPPDSGLQVEFPFRPCELYVAARVLLLMALSLSALCALSCYPLCLLPSSHAVSASLLLPSLLLSLVSTAAALVSSLLLAAARAPGWEWGGGYDSLCAGWGLGLLDTAILTGVLWQERQGTEQDEIAMKDALRVSERDVGEDEDA